MLISIIGTRTRYKVQGKQKQGTDKNTKQIRQGLAGRDGRKICVIDP